MSLLSMHHIYSIFHQAAVSVRQYQEKHDALHFYFIHNWTKENLGITGFLGFLKNNEIT